MSEVTQVLRRVELGDPSSAEQLLPLVYDELRKLAAAKLAEENAGHTLQATALVHEAYLRLVDKEQQQSWDNRRHFFAAAAESMRRILVESARRKKRLKHGGNLARQELLDDEIVAPELHEDLLELNESLERLAAEDGAAAELVKLRYFVGLTVQEAADTLGLSVRSTERLWTYARAWLYESLQSRKSDY